MRTPPFLMAAGLLLWGWQAELLHIGVLIAIVLEGSRRVEARWEFSEADLRRVWGLCTVLFLGATVMSFVSNDGASGLMGLLQADAGLRTESLNATTRSVLVLMQWLPLIFLPMMLLQAYGRGETIDARVFSWLLRQRHAKNPGLAPPPRLNVSHVYLVICLLAGSATNVNHDGFFPAVFLVLAWMLWRERNRRFSVGTWLCVVALVGVAGYGGQRGLRQLQRLVQQLDASWLSRFGPETFDRSSTVTDLGTVGRLKRSGNIVLRVRPETRPVPELLREVSYNEFESPGRWYSALKPFSLIPADETASTWNLLPDKPLGQSVRISRRMGRNGRGMIAMPAGTGRLEDLGVFLMETNGMGVARVNEGPGVVSYRARFDEGRTVDSPPELTDVSVPPKEEAAVQAVMRELGLEGLGAEEALAVLRRWFVDEFEYSVFLERPSGEHATPLAEFLLERRRGHCEYFATAAVLLLRQAKIPARYAVGYSVQEKRGESYVARGRHAHAWCVVHVDGRWIDFDPTPPAWNAIEAERASFVEPLRDALSDIWFAFSKWRWSEPGIRKHLPWLVVPPLVLVTARLVSKRQWRRTRRGAPAGARAVDWPGGDSEFYRIERWLADRGWARRPGESSVRWLARLGPERRQGTLLGELLALHDRYRFDPAGLRPRERAALRAGVENWTRASRRSGAGAARETDCQGARAGPI